MCISIDEDRRPASLLRGARYRRSTEFHGSLRLWPRPRHRDDDPAVLGATIDGLVVGDRLGFAAPDDVEASRWPFLARRALATHAPGSSHGEVVDPDAYAMSFWYEAALIVLLGEPYAIDFVRHRARQVARELANLLPLLEPDPEAPAAIRRSKPPTMPGV